MNFWPSHGKGHRIELRVCSVLAVCASDLVRVKMNPRPALVLAFREARACTDTLYSMVRPDSLFDRPIAERHRIIFYLGHLEAFDWNLLGREALGMPSFHAEFDRLFAFGIDPQVGSLQQDLPSDWPSVVEVQRYNQRVRQSLDTAMEAIPEHLLPVALEHRLMHAETFAYILHQLTPDRKMIPEVPLQLSAPQPAHTMIEIPAGQVTIGRSGKDGFGWDNEYEPQAVHVPSFSISKYKVTNRQYLAFARAGAEPPHFWTRDGDRWFWRTMAGAVPLPLEWPVYVSHQQAEAYARWVGKTLPTESQFHHAAYSAPNGEERPYPWGGEPPDPRRGNFDGRQWDPIPVTASPLGDSAFGVSQMVGNGWEWTSTLFQSLPGFRPFPFYPGYSAPFFDGGHYVLKGASARTAARLLRRSFRNWFRPQYSYVYAGFRCVDN